MDSDDLIEVTMYEKLYAKAKEADYDVVDSGYYKQAEDLAMLHVSDELSGVLDSAKKRADRKWRLYCQQNIPEGIICGSESAVSEKCNFGRCRFSGLSL